MRDRVGDRQVAKVEPALEHEKAAIRAASIDRCAVADHRQGRSRHQVDRFQIAGQRQRRPGGQADRVIDVGTRFRAADIERQQGVIQRRFRADRRGSDFRERGCRDHGQRYGLQHAAQPGRIGAGRGQRDRLALGAAEGRLDGDGRRRVRRAAGDAGESAEPAGLERGQTGQGELTAERVREPVAVLRMPSWIDGGTRSFPDRA